MMYSIMKYTDSNVKYMSSNVKYIDSYEQLHEQ